MQIKKIASYAAFLSYFPRKPLKTLTCSKVFWSRFSVWNGTLLAQWRVHVTVQNLCRFQMHVKCTFQSWGGKELKVIVKLKPNTHKRIIPKYSVFTRMLTVFQHSSSLSREIKHVNSILYSRLLDSNSRVVSSVLFPACPALKSIASFCSVDVGCSK